MKILQCDSCHAKVNDYAHWYNDEKPRNMYELKCVHESDSNNYNGMILCHECITKLLYKAENDTEVWNGMGGRQVIAPKGTFMKIYNECKEEEDDI